MMLEVIWFPKDSLLSKSNSINILKIPISSINLTIWLEFLKLDFHSKDMKTQNNENVFHNDVCGCRIVLYFMFKAALALEGGITLD
jgi:hypothetical protein